MVRADPLVIYRGNDLERDGNPALPLHGLREIMAIRFSELTNLPAHLQRSMFSIARRQSISVGLAATLLCSQLLASIAGQCGCPMEQPANCCVSEVAVAKPTCCSDAVDAGRSCACGTRCGKESQCGCGCEAPPQEQAPRSDGGKLPRSDEEQQFVPLVFKHAKSYAHRRTRWALGRTSSLLAGLPPSRILFCVWRI